MVSHGYSDGFTYLLHILIVEMGWRSPMTSEFFWRNHQLLVVMALFNKDDFQRHWRCEKGNRRLKGYGTSPAILAELGMVVGWGEVETPYFTIHPTYFFTCFLSAPIDRLDGSESITVPKASQTYHPYHIRHTILIISDIPSSLYLTCHPYHIRHTILIISDIPYLSYQTYHPYYIWHTILISDIPFLVYRTFHPY